jgi:hypothetical protein
MNAWMAAHPRTAEYFMHDGIQWWHHTSLVLFSTLKRLTMRGTPFSDTHLTPPPRRSLRSILSRIGIVAFMRLMSVGAVAYARIKGITTLIYTIDKIEGTYANDFRNDFIYTTLHEARHTPAPKASYLEIIHTIPSFTTIKNAWHRKRWVVYLERDTPFFDTTNTIPAHDPIVIGTASENAIAERLLSQMFYRHTITKRRLAWLSHLFTIVRPRLIYAIDDTRHYHELLHIANTYHVPTHVFQHGHFTKYHVGWLKIYQGEGAAVIPHKIYVWSEYWRTELIRLGSYIPREHIAIGAKRTYRPHASIPQSYVNKKYVLIPFETDAPKTEVKPFIDALRNQGQYTPLFKLRKDMSTEAQYTAYQLSTTDLAHTYDHTPYHADIAITLGTYSTFLYDMVEEGIPAGIIETSMDYGMGMVHNHIAALFKSPATLSADIATYLTTVDIPHIQQQLSHSTTETSSTTLRADIVHALYYTL